jgi:uncharacterized protein (DUF4415 family)
MSYVPSYYERHLAMSTHDMKRHSEPNWARVDALADDTIDTSDIPPLTEVQLARMTLWVPKQRLAITVSVDPDVLAWFRSQGHDFEQRINAALRIYVEAHKGGATPPAQKTET